MSIFDRFRPYPELKSVIVNLKSGSAFRGVIFRMGRGFMVLKNAAVLSDRGQRMEAKPLDGELLVLLSDIDFVQVM